MRCSVRPADGEKRGQVRIRGWAKATWGIVLVLLNLALVAHVAFLAIALSPLLAGGPGNWATLVLFGSASGPFLLWTSLSGLFAVVSFAVLGVSIAHLFKWGAVPENRRIPWLLVLILGMQPGMLVYWFANVLGWQDSRGLSRLEGEADTGC